MDPLEASITSVQRTGRKRFHHFFASHELTWQSIWNRCDIVLSGEEEEENGEVSIPHGIWDQYRVPVGAGKQVNHSELLK
jgi:hypothetical protein